LVIEGYFTLCYYWLFVAILPWAICGYSIGGYWWLLVAILLVYIYFIDGNFIGGHWLLFYWWLLMDIGSY
jgi:hypothetical protein